MSFKTLEEKNEAIKLAEVALEAVKEEEVAGVEEETV